MVKCNYLNQEEESFLYESYRSFKRIFKREPGHGEFFAFLIISNLKSSYRDRLADILCKAAWSWKVK